MMKICYFSYFLFILMISLIFPGKAENMNKKDPGDILLDFKSDTDLSGWQTVNDTVMGGVSSSKIVIDSTDTMIFTGNVSLENNGGFASIQYIAGNNYDFSDRKGFVIKILGDGKKYDFYIRQNQSWNSINYRQSFQTQKNGWIIQKIPFNKFKPTFRGTLSPNAGPLDPRRISVFGFLIADKQKGPFQLKVDWIGFY